MTDVSGAFDFTHDKLRSKVSKSAVLSFFVFSSLLFAFCLSAEAQQPKKVARIGYLSSTNPARESARFEAIRLALRELGYIEGQNIAFEYRYVELRQNRYSEFAAELVGLKVDMIVVVGGDPAIRAAMNATKTIPIIMMGGGAILSRQASWKALPVPLATSRA
jgi:ABC-type uncharacterized transport system substrate-binding protein